jgi:hypothetical protein
MGCLVALVALISPRLALFVLWVFGDVLGRAYDSWIVPVLGFFLLRESAEDQERTLISKLGASNRGEAAALAHRAGFELGGQRQRVDARQPRELADGQRRAAEVERPAVRARLVRERVQGAEAGDVDELQAGQVEDRHPVAARRVAHPPAQLGHRGEVQLALQAEQAFAALGVLGDPERHRAERALMRGGKS